MSAPAAVACGAAVLALALPVTLAAGTLEARHRLEGAADAAALAAADAAAGWIDAAPCDLAAEVLAAAGGELSGCSVDPAAGTVRIRAAVRTMLGTAHARARAGPPFT